MRAGQRLSSMLSACQKLLQEADLIVDIEHGEIGFQLHQFGMGAQDAPADGMKGAEPRHAFDGLAEHLAEPQLHLARRLVGEGDGEDFAGAGAAHAEDVGDAAGQHAGLAGAGARQHQHRSVQRFHRLALFGIEAGEILRGRGRPGARGDATCRGLVVGDAVMGQLVRLGHMRIVFRPRWHRGAVKGSLHSRIEGHIGLWRRI